MFDKHSKRVADLIFGQHDSLAFPEKSPNVREKITHPDGRKVEWVGGDGLVFHFAGLIEKLESKVLALEMEIACLKHPAAQVAEKASKK